jgi:hypothetical protein
VSSVFLTLCLTIKSLLFKYEYQINNQRDMKFVSLDVNNMCTSVPTGELINVIKKHLTLILSSWPLITKC